jgi:hypothetical protein
MQNVKNWLNLKKMREITMFFLLYWKIRQQVLKKDVKWLVLFSAFALKITCENGFLTTFEKV